MSVKAVSSVDVRFNGKSDETFVSGVSKQDHFHVSDSSTQSSRVSTQAVKCLEIVSAQKQAAKQCQFSMTSSANIGSVEDKEEIVEFFVTCDETTFCIDC